MSQETLDRPAGTPQPKTILIQQIPLGLIRPNPENRLVTPDMVDSMVETLKANGQKNAIKLRPLPEGTYHLYSGHVRLAGATKLGWATIAAVVSDITPAEAVVDGIWDNRNQPQTWLDDYRDIEALLKVNPDLTQPELTDLLGMGKSSIKRGKRFLRCLNQASRNLINQSLAQSRAAQVQKGRSSTLSPQVWVLTENPVYALTPLEEPEMVFKALGVLIERQLTEPQAKKLVEWVKAGNPPEAYSPQPKASTGKRPASPPSTKGGRGDLGETQSKVTAHGQAHQKPEIPTSATAPIGSPPRDDNQKITPVGEEAFSGTGLPLPRGHKPMGELWVCRSQGRSLRRPTRGPVPMTAIIPTWARLLAMTAIKVLTRVPSITFFGKRRPGYR